MNDQNFVSRLITNVHGNSEYLLQGENISEEERLLLTSPVEKIKFSLSVLEYQLLSIQRSTLDLVAKFESGEWCVDQQSSLKSLTALREQLVMIVDNDVSLLLKCIGAYQEMNKDVNLPCSLIVLLKSLTSAVTVLNNIYTYLNKEFNQELK